MKRKIVCVLMLTLILTSALSMAFIIKPSFAENGENSILGKDFMEKTGEATLQDKAVKPDQADTLNGSWCDIFERKPESNSNRNEWNFNETNEWSNFTYRDGNKTRLIIGVSGENPTSLVELEKIMAKHEARIVNSFSIGGQVRAIVVELPLVSVPAFVGEVHVTGLASYIEPNMRVQAQFVPNDPYWSLQWGPRKTEADWAWNVTEGGHDVLVAVVDTGIDYTHPDLAANYVALGYDWVNNDSDPRDDFGHGTHCAGIIAAVLNNSIGIAGLAQVRVMTEKVLDSYGSGWWDWVAQGIVHAVDQGANIISMSLGGYGDSELVHEAVKYAYYKGVLVIAAAGNDNTNMELYPAGYDEVVSVAATDQYDNKAWFSNWGEWIELAAPGVSIYSTMPTYHVTLNDWGYAMNYDYLSGTSMACPHVSGVAALIWSRFVNKTRDWVRMWLRYTADDLGDPGFDEYYGYGRINARKAVEQTPPAHDLIAYEWRTPSYLEPEASGIINATVLNFGEDNETGVTVQLLANDTIVDSTTIDYLASGNSETVSLLWNPTVEGTYNVTFYVVPAPGETTVENNVLWKYIYVGVPIKAVVLHSAGNVYGEIITNWQVLSNEWYLFGGTMVDIDYTTLNKDNITYDDINATRADVLIISCAYDPYAGWEFTDSEIEAIERYVYEGHGLIATAGTFYYQVPNNNKLAPLFGLNGTSMFSATETDLLHLLNTTHPLFMNVPNPLVFPQVGTALPYDGRWDSDELVGGKYLALGHYQESTIVSWKGLVYISPWLEVIPPYYHHHLQLLYNAITWSRYQKPQHEIVAALSAPKHVQPGESTLVNATVTNMGLNNESHVVLQLFIDGVNVDSAVVPELIEGQSYTLSYSWKPTVIGTHNLTAYALPVLGEDFIANNVASGMVCVSFTPKILVVDTPWPEDTGALDRIGYKYTAVSPVQFATVDLYEYNVLFVGWEPTESVIDALLARAPDIADWVAAGNGLVVLSEFEEPNRWAWLPLWVSSSGPVYGDSVHILDQTHPVMYGLSDAELSHWGNSYHGYFINYDIEWQALAEGVEAGSPITLAANYGNGRIVITHQDPDYHIYYRKEKGAEKILINMIEWANVYLEHDLAVSLNAPSFVKTGTSLLLNATVQNRGLNDETNVQLQLLINGAVVKSTSTPELSMGAYCTLSYSWTPMADGVYNVTAYSPPAENETNLNNNRATQLATVTQPLISPLEGQYANYTIYFTDPTNGTEVISGQWNFTYLSYVSTYQMNVTVWLTEQSGGYNYTQVGWLIVNVFTRMVEQDGGIYWSGMWFPGWIETNVTTGSTVNLLWGNATVVGNEVIYVGGRPIDCWDIELESSGYAYSFYYDKASGLWIGMRAQSSYEVASLRLEETNVPIGFAFAHDLALTIRVDSMIPMNESAIVNATVYNTGLNNEAHILLELLINGTVVDQLAVDELLVNQYRSLCYDWIPTSTGTHNVTAYAQPVAGEEYTLNNVAARTTIVFYYSRLYVSQRWVGGGIPMSWHSDDASWQYTLPFDFPFYGIPRRTIYISSNGLITFTDFDTSCGNSIDWLAQKLAIAPAWDDWVTYDPYDIYIWQNSTHVGIRWYVAAYHDRSVTANFEAILRSDGAIQFDYSFNNGSTSATIGISNGINHILAEEATNINCSNSILFLPFRTHDLSVALEAPKSLNRGDSALLNYTIKNTGLYNETNVQLYLFLNGSVARSTTIPVLDVDQFYSISYDWTPASVGDYNITAYAPPVAGEEEVADNNRMTAWVQVQGIHDVAVTNVEPSSNTMLVGDTADVNVTVENEGDYPENFTVTAYASQGNSAVKTNIVSNGTRIYLDPSEYIFNSKIVSVGYRFNVTLRVADVENLSAFQLSMYYNESMINATRWFEPAWDPEYVFYNESTVTAEIFRTGNIMLFAGLLGNQPLFIGNGKLCMVEFEIVNLPPVGIKYSCPLSINNGDTFLLMPMGWDVYEIPAVKEDGYYEVSSESHSSVFAIGSVTVSLSPGGTMNLVIPWDTRDVSPGDYTISAYASVVPGETCVENNMFSDGVVSLLTHDVAVVGVTPYTHWVYQGLSVNVSVEVENKGGVAETVTVTLYYNITAHRTIGVLNTIILPGENQTVTFTWNTAGVPYCHNYTITAVASIPVDSNLSDNTLSDGGIKVRLLGDINGDGKVDGEDIALAAVCFGSAHGYSRWNPDADVNADGRIDGKDIVEIAINFGLCAF